MKQNKRAIIKNTAVYLFLSIMGAGFVFPFLWMLSGAFKNSLEVVQMPPKLLPSKIDFSNFIELRNYFPLELFLMNSISVSVISTVLQLLLCSMAAFVFAKLSFRFRETFFFLFLLTIMMPFQVRVTPIYMLFSKIGLDDTYLGLLLPGIFSAFGIFLLKQHMVTIPNAFLESAYMDGASYFTVFVKIVLPLSKVALATLSIFLFMNSWNDFLWPLIIITNINLATLPLGLSRLSGRFSTEWNILMAGDIVAIIPILCVYLFTQKYIIKGISLGGIKG